MVVLNQTVDTSLLERILESHNQGILSADVVEQIDYYDHYCGVPRDEREAYLLGKAKTYKVVVKMIKSGFIVPEFEQHRLKERIERWRKIAVAEYRFMNILKAEEENEERTKKIDCLRRAGDAITNEVLPVLREIIASETMRYVPEMNPLRDRLKELFDTNECFRMAPFTKHRLASKLSYCTHHGMSKGSPSLLVSMDRRITKSVHSRGVAEVLGCYAPVVYLDT